MSIGTIIKNHRGERTLANISEETGISLAMLSLIEQDKRNPSETSLVALAEAFGTTVFNLRFELEWGVTWETFGASIVGTARETGSNKARNQINRVWKNPSLAK